MKYWVVAQRHTDLRDHFQTLARATGRTRGTAHRASTERERLREERDRLRQHCAGLEQLLQTYAVVINELALENKALREKSTSTHPSVTPFRTPRRRES